MRPFLFQTPWLAGLIGAVFAIAGVSKLGNSALTFAGIQQYELLDANLAYGVAEWLPWFEIALAIAVWLPFSRRIGLAAAFAVQLIFLIAAVQAIARGLEITCVCFGSPLGASASLLIQEILFLTLTGLAGWRELQIARK